MKNLIKWYQTPRNDLFIYIYRSDESNHKTQEVFSQEEGDKMISDGDAVEISFAGSYLDAQKIADGEASTEEAQAAATALANENGLI